MALKKDIVITAYGVISPIGVTSIHPGGVSTGISRTVRVTNEEARTQLHQTMEQYGLARLKKGEGGRHTPSVPYTDIVLDVPKKG